MRCRVWLAKEKNLSGLVAVYARKYIFLLKFLLVVARLSDWQMYSL